MLGSSSSLMTGELDKDDSTWGLRWQRGGICGRLFNLSKTFIFLRAGELRSLKGGMHSRFLVTMGADLSSRGDGQFVTERGFEIHPLGISAGERGTGCLVISETGYDIWIDVSLGNMIGVWSPVSQFVGSVRKWRNLSSWSSWTTPLWWDQRSVVRESPNKCHRAKFVAAMRRYGLRTQKTKRRLSCSGPVVPLLLGFLVRMKVLSLSPCWLTIMISRFGVKLLWSISGKVEEAENSNGRRRWSYQDLKIFVACNSWL